MFADVQSLCQRMLKIQASLGYEYFVCILNL